jgi:hypothetical protein
VGGDARTIADGWTRAGRQGQAVHASLVEQPRARGQVQADELRVTKQGGMVWMAMAMMVQTRLGLGGEVSAPRARPLIRRRLERVRRCAVHRPRLVCPDGVCTSIRAMRETGRAPVRTGTGGRPWLRPWRNVLLAPVGKRAARRRGVDTERRLVAGTLARVETLRRRSPGDGVLNTADLERLNATCRERLAPLARRCRALARETLTRHEGLLLVGTVDHFCLPQERLCCAQQTTPAMAAGLTDQCWTMQALLSLHVPLPRWVPRSSAGVLRGHCNA